MNCLGMRPDMGHLYLLAINSDNAIMYNVIDTLTSIGSTVLYK